MSNYESTMSALGDALKTQAEALKNLERVVRELGRTPVPSSPKSASSGTSEGLEVKYARASDLAKRFGFRNEQGIIPIIQQGLKEGAIKKMGGRGDDKKRGAVATFLVSDVDAYMEKIRGN